MRRGKKELVKVETHDRILKMTGKHANENCFEYRGSCHARHLSIANRFSLLVVRDNDTYNELCSDGQKFFQVGQQQQQWRLVV